VGTAKTEPRAVSAKSADNLSSCTDSATIYHATPDSSGADTDAKRLGKQVVGGLLTERSLPIHKPSKASQAVSTIAFDLIGVYLIFRGIRQGFTRPEPQPDTLSPQSPESGQ
jgi:hypothetical protein